jgi:sugar phosphate isomerase/epimerase
MNGAEVWTMQYGYCTNVHAGADLQQTRANLERYALAVKRRFSPEAPMGIGLWLSASAARKLVGEGRVGEFAAWLAEVGLVPFTLNGFPFGDFHQPIVKHRVYEPTWWEPSRLAYTRDLIAILDGLLPPGMDGSISTLPLAWGDPAPEPGRMKAAAEALREVAADLARLELETGRLIRLCLEPEPGCVVQYSGDAVRLFEGHLLGGPDEAAVRRHLGVCHDVCHAAVMFEDQAEVLRRYAAAGITVGKVQVSSAVRLPGGLTGEERAAALRQLGGFAEDRYLHQTMVRREPGAPPLFYEDLPGALAAECAGEWRVHFHVPVYLERFGRLEALQPPIVECLQEARGMCDHFEVETYAWGVLPAELRQPDLAAGIADELAWFRSAWRQVAGD